MNMFRGRQAMKVWLLALSVLLGIRSMSAQNPDTSVNGAGYVPLISGGAGYVHNVNGGKPTLEPQINPVLLVPFGSHVLLESRTDFTGFFQRENGSSGPFTGKVFKTVEYAQIDWLANTHVIATAGRYLLPFGLYNERLTPIWIRNLQDSPITASIGTRTSGSGDGVMLRGVASETSAFSIQYTAYFSVRSGINQLQAGRATGGDASIYIKNARIEVGTSYQRLLQDNQMNSFGAYVSWQPSKAPVDTKFEYDQSHNGHGFWLESAYQLTEMPKVPALLKKVQLVGRVQQFSPLNGGGNGVPRVATERFDAGLNYYIRDDLRFISSYGRQFSSSGNANIWNAGFTYRFMFPLWPGRKR
jgi:hypothetical protein